MELKITEERDNPFFKRKDLRISVRNLGMSTPSKVEIIKQLAEKYSVDELQVQIKYIHAKSGFGESLVSAKILKEKPKQVKQEAKSEENEAPANTTE